MIWFWSALLLSALILVPHRIGWFLTGRNDYDGFTRYTSWALGFLMMIVVAGLSLGSYAIVRMVMK